MTGDDQKSWLHSIAERKILGTKKEKGSVMTSVGQIGWKIGSYHPAAYPPPFTLWVSAITQPSELLACMSLNREQSVPTFSRDVTQDSRVGSREIAN